MGSIFDFAETALKCANREELLKLTHEAWRLCEKEELHFTSENLPKSIENVYFPERPILLPPREMPKRKFHTQEGLAAFFHAIAHVEFVAIYLAWDIVYRFRDLPEEFYRDWLRVADEEAQHFSLLQTKLKTFGFDYGDLPAHSGLWDLAQFTATDFLQRLALVPRNMEAHGLDVTPPLIEKFKQLSDDNAVEILTRILNDEVGHVALGSKWFKWLCEQKNLDVEMTYQNILLDYYATKGGNLKGNFNYEMRLKAGFSENELAWLNAQSQ
ncbi:MAG: ferritin-like domain-containing protein [Methylococcaceae bacterium]